MLEVKMNPSPRSYPHRGVVQIVIAPLNCFGRIGINYYQIVKLAAQNSEVAWFELFPPRLYLIFADFLFPVLLVFNQRDLASGWDDRVSVVYKVKD